MMQPLVKTKSKVLVIDDSLMARKLIVSYLNSDEYEIYEGKNGREGLAVASEVHPDVILLDFVMPGMNGYEVYQALRSQDDFSSTPVIVFSSSYDEVVKKFGYPFQGFEFLHKHATNEQVLACIQSLLPGAEPKVDGVQTHDLLSELLEQDMALASDVDAGVPLAAVKPGTDYEHNSNDIADALASLYELDKSVSEISDEGTIPTNPIPLVPPTIETQGTSSAGASTQTSDEVVKTVTAQGATLRSLQKTVDMLQFQMQQLENRVDKYASRERPTPSFWTWLMVCTVISAVVGTLTSSLLLRPVEHNAPESQPVAPLDSNTSVPPGSPPQ